jgi:hypothetical protein
LRYEVKGLRGNVWLCMLVIDKELEKITNQSVNYTLQFSN